VERSCGDTRLDGLQLDQVNSLLRQARSNDDFYSLHMSKRSPERLCKTRKDVSLASANKLVDLLDGRPVVQCLRVRKAPGGRHQGRPRVSRPLQSTTPALSGWKPPRASSGGPGLRIASIAIALPRRRSRSSCYMPSRPSRMCTRFPCGSSRMSTGI